MQKQIPLIPGNYYHLYNRGINGESIFREERNYLKFLELYSNFVHPVVDTLAYSLLGNHFHLVIKPREFCRHECSIYSFIGDTKLVPERISKQFSHFFNSYAQGFNKMFERTGALFETPFRRKLVDNTMYLDQLIHYVHSNPQSHGLIGDYREWPYSSYRNYRSPAGASIISDEGFNFLGQPHDWHNYQLTKADITMITPFILDMEEMIR